MRLQRIVDQVRPFHVAGRIEALDTGQLFRFANAFVGQRDVVLFLIDGEVQFFGQLTARRDRLPA